MELEEKNNQTSFLSENTLKENESNNINNDNEIESQENKEKVVVSNKKVIKEARYSFDGERNLDLVSTDSDSSCDEDENQENTSGKKTCLQRYFGKMKDGSLRSSIFILTNVALGISVFSLAKSFKVLGIIPSIILCIICSLIAYQTLKQLGRVCKLEEIYDLSTLVKVKFGGFYQKLYDILIMINLFGVLLSTQVITNKLVGYIVYEIGFNGPNYPTAESFLKNPDGWYNIGYRFLSNFSISLFFFMPFCFPKDLSKIAWTSIVGMFGLFYAVGVS